MSRAWRWILSALLGLSLPWIPGLWVPGMFIAALPFPEGIHSDYADFYLVLAMTIDFFLYAGVAYWLLTWAAKRRVA